MFGIISYTFLVTSSRLLHVIDRFVIGNVLVYFTCCGTGKLSFFTNILTLCLISLLRYLDSEVFMTLTHISLEEFLSLYLFICLFLNAYRGGREKYSDHEYMLLDV